MENAFPKSPSDCRILVVDDEPAICEFLKTALDDLYHVQTVLCGEDALRLIRDIEFDVVVTDLRLPDVSGMEILKAAKEKDEFTEVIIITGYATIETAAEAINLGVNSYLIKPLAIQDLVQQVERSVSNRIFHLKSMHVINYPNGVAPHIKGHLYEITSLYHFSRKLMLTLDVSEIMRVILEEANQQMDSGYSLIAVNFLDFKEVYAMPRNGDISLEEVKEGIDRCTLSGVGLGDNEKTETSETEIFTLKGRAGDRSSGQSGEPVVIPMNVLGKAIGFIAVFPNGTDTPPGGRMQFLHVFASMISPIIEHGYLDMQAKRLAKTDSLTGIGNHRMFHETLEREIARTTRYSRKFCLAIIDVDDFKKINDTYGHLIGDAVLRGLTKRINDRIRLNDVLARYGGEEFALVLPDTDLSGGKILLNRILEAISENKFEVPVGSLRCTVSIGMTEFNGENIKDKNTLIGIADKAMYESKRLGKNRVTVG